MKILTIRTDSEINARFIANAIEYIVRGMPAMVHSNCIMLDIDNKEEADLLENELKEILSAADVKYSFHIEK